VNISQVQSEKDWEKIKEICVLSSGIKPPLSQERSFSFGRVWIDPYQLICPEYTLAVFDSDLIGYLTGAIDRSFFEKRNAVYTELVHEISGPEQEKLKQQLDGEALWPEQLLGKVYFEELIEDYPAHLHINFLKNHQGKGLGTLLIQNFENKLKEKKISGVHVICGKRPVPFYEKLGFQILKSENQIYAMGKKL
tara:strand:+ start:6503 stop:7084 length:582 start_codon:yes stop_codon:yes gene_type:complete